jgi:hypothetical protein
MEYYLIDEKNQQIGPFTIEQLKTKGVQRKTKVWCEGMENWTDAEQVPELMNSLNLPPPTPSSSSSSSPPTPPTYQSHVHTDSRQQAGSTGDSLPLFDPLIYDPNYNLESLSDSLKEECKKHRFMEPFSPALCVILHIFTLGIFTIIHCGIMHDNLPRISHKDFGAGKAIGFRFIPIYNIYWIFVFWEQLARRINFQFRLRNKTAPVSVALADWACILRIMGLIPYLGYVTVAIAFFVLFPILFASVRSACNELALERLSR